MILIQLIIPLAGLRFSKDAGKCFFSTWMHSALSACPIVPLESIPMGEIAESKEMGILGFGVLATWRSGRVLLLVSVPTNGVYDTPRHHCS